MWFLSRLGFSTWSEAIRLESVGSSESFEFPDLKGFEESALRSNLAWR